MTWSCSPSRDTKAENKIQSVDEILMYDYLYRVTWLRLRVSSPSFAQSVVRDGKENRETKMAARNPGGEERAKIVI